MVTVAGVEVAEFDGRGQFLGDDGGEWIAEDGEGPGLQELLVLDDLRLRGDGITDTDVELKFELRARAIEAGITSRSPW
nr:hypothetical protein [Kribbella pittospori]